MGAVLSPFANGLPTTGGTITGNLTVQGQLTSSSPLLVAGYTPVVASAPVTVAGTTPGVVLPGMIIPSGGFAQGQLYRIHAWGTLTTAASADTFTLSVLLGGIGGTTIFSFGPQQPSGSQAVAGVDWEVMTDIDLVTATRTSVAAGDALNFFPSAIGSSLTNISNNTAQQLVVASTASAAGDSITCNGGYCLRVT